MQLHNDNHSASAEGEATNSQRYGSPTITVSLGDLMNFLLVEDGEGTGLVHGEGLQETQPLEAGKLLVLDPFTDNALKHKVTWPADANDGVERWVFVFRCTQLQDYFDIGTHLAAPR